MRDLSDELAALRVRLDASHEYLDIERSTARRPQLETEASRPDLWDDPEVAKKVNAELAAAVEDLDLVDALKEQLDDVTTLWQLAREENDDSVTDEIDAGMASLRERFDELELRALFVEEYDERDAVCEVHSGAGGTDSQDWAEILLRMYQGWAEQAG